MTAAANERQKLIANWFNAISAGSVTAGVITPIIALQTGVIKDVPEAEFISGSMTWFFVGLVLHLFALATLIGYDAS